MSVTKQDCQIVLDLLNEHFNATVSMQIKHIRSGRANPDLKRFTVPFWALDMGETYAFYYVIHEFTHAWFNDWGHDSQFKHHEDSLLDLFGLKIDRAKIFPKRLYLNGECQYKKANK